MSGRINVFSALIMRKTDIRVTTRSTSKSEHEGAATPMAESEANRSLLASMREMMEEMRGDIMNGLGDIVSDVVKKEITGALSPLEARIASFSSAVRDLEQAANEQDGRLTVVQASVSQLQDQVASLTRKCEDLEGRSRLNNIRIVGIPENSEGPRPTEFVAGLLHDLLRLDAKPVLDRAHRTLRPRPGEGAPPRPFVVRVNMYQVRNEILRKARESPLHFNGRRVLIFPDYTTAVAKKRATFGRVKKELHSCPGVKFGLLFPATLQITLTSGTSHKFEDPDAALDFVEKNIKTVVAPDSV
ncbi:unnamed protein product [Knipowitschia caucasica]|uniref:Transposase element L1Md-A101/L1Md-A102/L1Md-A2 n=1 Tax=Knipowitschia caucasica TaxID=637954 RepID=A0AAV2LFA6_KNICA